MFSLWNSYLTSFESYLELIPFCPFSGNFAKFRSFSACRNKGLVEGFYADCGPRLDALGVELPS